MKLNLLFMVALLCSILPAGRSRGGTFSIDYSTYLGGGSNDYGWSIAVDSDGSAYICGNTSSVDFPTGSPYQPGGNGNVDAFVAKFTTSGSALLYSTYLGGAGNDYGYSIEVDSVGSAYLCGSTASADFPTVNPYQAGNAGGTDLFIARLSSPGDALDYSTYAGGSVDDTGYGIALADGKAYVTGYTSSDNFPTGNAYQPGRGGGEDGFVFLLSTSGSQCLYSTYLGGNLEDCGNGVAVEGSGSAYVAGYTKSADFPTADPYQPAKAGGTGTYDVFLARISSAGSDLLYSTYLGGDNHDLADGVVLDASGFAWIAGETFSDNFPTLNPFQSSKADNYDAFLTGFSSSGSSLMYSTYLGGAGADFVGGKHGASANGSGISIDTEGRVSLTGSTQSMDFPTLNAYQPSHRGGTEDVFVTRFLASGSGLSFSTYLGGSGADYGYSAAVSQDNWLYLTGSTASDDFPTVNPYQSARAGGADALVGKIRWTTPTPSITPTPSPSVTPSTSPTITPTPRDMPCQATPLYLKVLEDAAIHTTRSSRPDGWTYYFKAYLSDTVTLEWGYIRDSQNSFVSTTDISISYQLFINLEVGLEDWNIHTGDYLTVEYDGGQSTRIYLPGVTGSSPGKLFYPDREGNTYHDANLCNLWQARPTPTSTPVSDAVPWSALASGDYDGDGTADIAVFRRSSGLWAVRALTRAYFGGQSDLPVPGDYDGDGSSDIGIYRSGTGLWAIRSITRFYFGASSDLPVPGDYNGNAGCEAGVFRGSSGLWAIRAVTRAYFGSSADEPVPGDYNGDGTGEIGLFRPSSGLWALRGVSRIYYGTAGDLVVPGDYGGGGIRTPGVFRESSGLWAIRGLTRIYYGAPDDRPVPADYAGAVRAEPAIFRDSAGLWAVRGITRVYFGASNDIPVTR